MRLYRISENNRPKTIRDYYNCVLRTKKTECIEEFLDKIQTEDGIAELAKVSYETANNALFQINDVIKRYLFGGFNLKVNEKDIRRIINYAEITGHLFQFQNKEYLVKLFWSYSLPKDMCYKLYGFMTKDKTLINGTYCGYILSDSEFPQELLVDALKYDKAPIAQWASQNENVPQDALFEWYRRTGQIETEDPTQHQIEQIPQKEDEDFSKLRELVGKNFKMYKVSEKEIRPTLTNVDECINNDSCINAFFEILKDPWKTEQLDESVPEFWRDSNNVRSFLSDICRWKSRRHLLNDNHIRTIIDFAIRTGDIFRPSRHLNTGYIRYFLIGTPHMPKDVFYRLFELIDQSKLQSSDHIADILTNPSCPIEILEKIMFSYGYPEYYGEWASENPSLPIDMKIKWLKQRGDIEIENPSKHQIEEVPQKEDEDFGKLKELVGKNFKMYRVAMIKESYNDDIAKNTKDPKLLEKIVVEHHSYISGIAAQNKHCPPEVLAYVLRKEEKDYRSQCAAANPNCPPEVLMEVLAKDNDDAVPQYAAMNKSCPPEAIRLVLDRKRKDKVSFRAAFNPNCPLDAKLKWLRDTGQVAIEDPSIHKIEQIPQKEDDDFSQLQGLIM